ncbi:MAG: response regulator transcription factor, partial [Myxococcota bacterium]
MTVKILVADDSATMRKIFEMTFAGEDAEVVTVDGGDAALATARELHPDVVLADSSMDGTDGYEVARSLKGAGGNPPAVIVLASQHTPYDAERGRAAGVDDHVLKPFDTQSLIDKVKGVAGKPRAAARPAAAQPAAAPKAPPAAAARP